MASQEHLDKMQLRQNYRNLWHTDLMGTVKVDSPSQIAAWLFGDVDFLIQRWVEQILTRRSIAIPQNVHSIPIGPCVSYLLRKRALYNDMSRYVCCAGYMPCSGRCGESRCPELCLATETQHKIEMDKRDGMFGPQPVMAVPPAQQMSRIDQQIPPSIGYPPQTYGQSYGQQPYGYPPQPPQGYPAAVYPPSNHPPPGYPPSGYPK